MQTTANNVTRTELSNQFAAAFIQTNGQTVTVVSTTDSRAQIEGRTRTVWTAADNPHRGWFHIGAGMVQEVTIKGGRWVLADGVGSFVR